MAIASRADRDTLALTTLAGVANDYFQVLSLRERLAVARSNVEAARNLMEIVDSRFKVGLSNPVEVATQKAALASTELVIPELEQSQQEAAASLAVLLGRAPEDFKVEGVPLESLKEPTVAAGLPSELLRRRPDVFTAEANLESASSDLVAARAALFPSLTLTASGGVQNPDFLAQLAQIAEKGTPLLFLCRSGVRSQHAAKLATEHGYSNCFNILEGFEGDKDDKGHRKNINGWCKVGLPWMGA